MQVRISAVWPIVKARFNEVVRFIVLGVIFKWITIYFFFTIIHS